MPRLRFFASKGCYEASESLICHATVTRRPFPARITTEGGPHEVLSCQARDPGRRFRNGGRSARPSDDRAGGDPRASLAREKARGEGRQAGRRGAQGAEGVPV